MPRLEIPSRSFCCTCLTFWRVGLVPTDEVSPQVFPRTLPRAFPRKASPWGEAPPQAVMRGLRKRNGKKRPHPSGYRRPPSPCARGKASGDTRSLIAQFSLLLRNPSMIPSWFFVTFLAQESNVPSSPRPPSLRNFPVLHLQHRLGFCARQVGKVRAGQQGLHAADALQQARAAAKVQFA